MNVLKSLVFGSATAEILQQPPDDKYKEKFTQVVAQVESLDEAKNKQNFFEEINFELGKIEDDVRLESIKNRLHNKQYFIKKNLNYISKVGDHEYKALQRYILADDQDEEAASSVLESAINAKKEKNRKAWEAQRALIQKWKSLRQSSCIFPDIHYISETEIKEFDKFFSSFQQEEVYQDNHDYQEKDISIMSELIREKSELIMPRQKIEDQCIPDLFKDNVLDMSEEEKIKLKTFLSLEYKGDFDAKKFISTKLEWARNTERIELIKRWNINYKEGNQNHERLKLSYLTAIHDHASGSMGLSKIKKLVARLVRQQEEVKPDESFNVPQRDEASFTDPSSKKAKEKEKKLEKSIALPQKTKYIEKITTEIENRKKAYTEMGVGGQEKRHNAIKTVETYFEIIKNGYQKLRKKSLDSSNKEEILTLYQNTLYLSYLLGVFSGTTTLAPSGAEHGLIHRKKTADEIKTISIINGVMRNIRKEIITVLVTIAPLSFQITRIGINYLIDMTQEIMKKYQSFSLLDHREKLTQINYINICINSINQAIGTEDPLERELFDSKYQTISSNMGKVLSAVTIFAEKAQPSTPDEEAYIMYTNAVIEDSKMGARVFKR